MSRVSWLHFRKYLIEQLIDTVSSLNTGSTHRLGKHAIAKGNK
ncbi:hypothetical protein [Allocoleopsis franciscana]|nr:hypothetical protein [Allocoleopsis franciscana]